MSNKISEHCYQQRFLNVVADLSLVSIYGTCDNTCIFSPISAFPSIQIFPHMPFTAPHSLLPPTTCTHKHTSQLNTQHSECTTSSPASCTILATYLEEHSLSHQTHLDSQYGRHTKLLVGCMSPQCKSTPHHYKLYKHKSCYKAQNKYIVLNCTVTSFPTSMFYLLILLTLFIDIKMYWFFIIYVHVLDLSTSELVFLSQQGTKNC